MNIFIVGGNAGTNCAWNEENFESHEYNSENTHC